MTQYIERSAAITGRTFDSGIYLDSRLGRYTNDRNTPLNPFTINQNTTTPATANQSIAYKFHEQYESSVAAKTAARPIYSRADLVPIPIDQRDVYDIKIIGQQIQIQTKYKSYAGHRTNVRTMPIDFAGYPTQVYSIREDYGGGAQFIIFADGTAMFVSNYGSAPTAKTEILGKLVANTIQSECVY